MCDNAIDILISNDLTKSEILNATSMHSDSKSTPPHEITCGGVFFSLLGKIFYCIVITNVLNYLADKFYIIGVLAFFDKRSEHIAEYASEIFVTSVGQETAAVGEHPDKLADKSELRERRELLLHAVLLIVEPPCRAKLHLADDTALLETVHDRREDFVVARVQAVQNGLWKLVSAVESIKQHRQLLREGLILDSVKSRIGTEQSHITP